MRKFKKNEETVKNPTADIVVGLGWGDEGKGATVDFLSSLHKPNRVVRFNGGQQAAHNVIAGDFHHTFSNFGSGTLNGASTFISSYCTANPISAYQEKIALRNHLTPETEFIKIHEDVKITTELHILLNHLKENSRGDARHGSTGTGFGETIAWEYYGNTPLRAKDISNKKYINDWLQEYSKVNNLNVTDKEIQKISSTIHETFPKVFKIVTNDEFLQEISEGYTIFEGAQGFLLDENFGQNPHTTWSTTTPSNAMAILRSAGVTEDQIKVYGCMRTYATRHGAGPLPFEHDVPITELHNGTNEWAGSFRTAEWDKNILEWATNKINPDYLSISHLDKFQEIQTSKGPMTPSSLGKVKIEAYGPRREDRRLR